jgi:hypothetical protein
MQSNSDSDSDDSSSRPPVESNIILPVHRRELSLGENCTLPSLVWPGSDEAIRRQCSCPIEENQKRLTMGAAPKLRRDCRVHNKICQADECGHGGHLGTHFRCEHCTNVLHTCVICEAVYLDDGDDPSLFGWLLVENDPVVKGWRCWRCR